MTDQQQEQAAPVDWQDIARQRERELKSVGEARHRAEAEVARLRAGEEDGWDPAVYPTPGQWIARFNQATPQERHDAAKWAIDNSQRASNCVLSNHENRLAEQHQAFAALARVRALRDRWSLMTLEPGQVRRLLDEIGRALHVPQQERHVAEAHSEFTDEEARNRASDAYRQAVQRIESSGPKAGHDGGPSVAECARDDR